jgi:hypothetical protein
VIYWVLSGAAHWILHIKKDTLLRSWADTHRSVRAGIRIVNR